VSPTAQHRSPLESVFSLLGKGLALGGVWVALMGCSGSTKVEVPAYDPSGAASRAMELYDKNGDGLIAEEELEIAVGLKAGIKNIDTNEDGKISADEIAARVAVWEKMAIGLMRVSCEVTLDNVPLDGATVTFEPEEFLGGAIQEAVSVSRLGSASPIIPVENRSSPDVPPGIQVGLYKVKISKKQGTEELIPSQYNEKTILGQEVAQDDAAVSNNQVRFNLRSK
jgi:hypothetical protein